MPVYSCKVADSSGKTLDITREASNMDSLILDLMQHKYSPLKISEIKNREEATATTTGSRFSRATIIEFTETISLLLSSGLSLKDSLDILRTIFTKGDVLKLTNTLIEKIKKGDSFHQALDKFSDSFPPLYRGLVKIGEKVGSLENIFERLAGYLRESKKVKDKLVSAVSGPLVSLGSAVIMVIAMAIFIFPKIRQIFSELQSGVNSQLQSSMDFINVFFIIGGTIIGIAAAAVVAMFIIRKTKGYLRDQLDIFLLKIPIFGKVIYIQESLNFLFAMETLTGSGFSVEDALPEAGKVFSNTALLSGVGRIREKIIKGEHLSTAFLQDPYFEERIGHWMSIGERSGKVEKVFGQLHQYYQEELDKWSAQFMGIMEPALTLFTGIVIMVLVLTVFVPLFSIYKAVL